jgi:hypothetical protein
MSSLSTFNFSDFQLALVFALYCLFRSTLHVALRTNTGACRAENAKWAILRHAAVSSPTVAEIVAMQRRVSCFPPFDVAQMAHRCGAFPSSRVSFQRQFCDTKILDARNRRGIGCCYEKGRIYWTLPFCSLNRGIRQSTGRVRDSGRRRLESPTPVPSNQNRRQMSTAVCWFRW